MPLFEFESPAHIRRPLLFLEPCLGSRAGGSAEGHEIKFNGKPARHGPGQNQGLVEASFPQALDMKGDGHEDIVLSDIESLMGQCGHEGPQGLSGVKTAVVLEPLDDFEE